MKRGGTPPLSGVTSSTLRPGGTASLRRVTEKLIATLRHADPGEALRSAGLRAGLAGLGATALQVNLDDAAVAPAMRFGPGAPITAVVSIWTSGSAGAALRLVSDAVGESEPDAYRVAERVRLDPLPVPDGERADVLANVAILRRPASMAPEEYLAYWMVHHTPIAIRTQATSGYIQNVVEETLTPGAPEISAIVEEHFPMAGMTDPHAFYGSGGDEAELNRRIAELMASVVRFGADQGLDLVPTSRYFWKLGDS